MEDEPADHPGPTQQVSGPPPPATAAPSRPPALSGHLSWRAVGPSLWRCAEAGSGGPQLVRACTAAERHPETTAAALPAGVEGPSGRPAQARLIPGRLAADANGVGWVVHDDPGGLPAHDPAAGQARVGGLGAGALTADAGADVARALAALHRAGHTHGSVGPQAVLVGADGGGWLLDTVGAVGTAEADVAGLAALVESALGPLVGVIGDGDPPTTAEGWARRLRAGPEESPLAGLRAQARTAHEGRAAEAGRGTGRIRAHRWGRRRWALAVLAPVLVVAALGAVGLARPPAGGTDPFEWGATAPSYDARATRPMSSPTSSPRSRPVATPAATAGAPDTPSPPAAEQDWRAVLAALDAARAQALAAADTRSLAAVVAAGSPAAAAEESRIEALDAAGLRVVGLERELVSVVPVEPSAEGSTSGVVWLRVVDRLSPHQVVDWAGVVVEGRSGRAEAAWTVTLRQVGGGWRIAEVVPA